MNNTIRLVFVDDHGLGRHELSELVEARAGMKFLARVGKPGLSWPSSTWPRG